MYINKRPLNEFFDEYVITGDSMHVSYRVEYKKSIFGEVGIINKFVKITDDTISYMINEFEPDFIEYVRDDSFIIRVHIFNEHEYSWFSLRHIVDKYKDYILPNNKVSSNNIIDNAIRDTLYAIGVDGSWHNRYGLVTQKWLDNNREILLRKIGFTNCLSRRTNAVYLRKCIEPVMVRFKDSIYKQLGIQKY